MKRSAILLLAVMCVATIGCSIDAEINQFVSEFETVTNEMTTKLDADDIDGAQAAFDAKKENLRKSFDSFKDARGFQVGDETKTKATQSITKSATAFGISAAKAKIRAANNPKKTKKIDALINDYKNIVQM